MAVPAWLRSAWSPGTTDRGRSGRGEVERGIPDDLPEVAVGIVEVSRLDDVDVSAALIDGGADIDAPGGSIGTPLANAVGYGCWHVARLLAARGARIGTLWEAAALGDQAKTDEFLAADPPPARDDIDEAFWQACHGGQRRMAEYLLAQGATITIIPGYSEQTALQAAAGAGTRRQILVDWLKQHGAAEG
jgi:ankyrin repeat protein